MLRKILILFLISLCLFLFINMYLQSPVKEHPAGPEKKSEDINSKDNQHSKTGRNASVIINITTSEVSPNARTYYKSQSNGCTHYIQQDPVNKKYLHAVWMCTPNLLPIYPNRRTQYYFSNDTGNTWSFLGDVPEVRSGYPAICLLNSGIPVIANHSLDGGGNLRTQLYVDAAIGSGSFNRLDPVQPNILWPNLVATSSVTNTNKIVFMGSVNNVYPNDSAYRNVCTGLTPTGTFVGYVFVPQMTTAGAYALARGADGRIGCAFMGRTPYDGGAFIMESTDNGSSFSSPSQIWFPNSISSDSMIAYGCIDIKYQGTIPKVVFCTIKESNTGFDRSKIMFWSPSVNGGNAIVIDSSGRLNGSNSFIGVSRAVLGVSQDQQLLYLAWSKARFDTSSQGYNYYDIYFHYSTNNGSSWPLSQRARITNNSGPLHHCDFPSLPDMSHNSGSAYFVHMIYEDDTIPGNAFDSSLAKMMHARITISGVIGIQNSNNNIPERFHLYQNYPNPCNPSTKIKFDIPNLSSSNTTITIYNILGKKFEALINEILKPGTYEIDWDASEYPSGIYYYRLTAGNYTETKKMVLLK